MDHLKLAKIYWAMWCHTHWRLFVLKFGRQQDAATWQDCVAHPHYTVVTKSIDAAIWAQRHIIMECLGTKQTDHLCVLTAAKFACTGPLLWKYKMGQKQEVSSKIANNFVYTHYFLQSNVAAPFTANCLSCTSRNASIYHWRWKALWLQHYMGRDPQHNTKV